MKLATDEQILEMFNKYRKDVIKLIVDTAKEKGFEAPEEIEEVGLWDEVFSNMVDADFVTEVVDGIEDSVGLEDYGFVDQNSDE